MPIDEFSKIDEEVFETTLEENFSFEGTINIKESLLVKGNVKGSIDSDNLLVIGPKSVISADVCAKQLECFGKITGNVIIEGEAYFHNLSELTGNLKVKLLTIEKGCTINGKIEMNKETS